MPQDHIVERQQCKPLHRYPPHCFPSWKHYILIVWDFLFTSKYLRTPMGRIWNLLDFMRLFLWQLRLCSKGRSVALSLSSYSASLPRAGFFSAFSFSDFLLLCVYLPSSVTVLFATLLGDQRSRKNRFTDRHSFHDFASIGCCLGALRHTFLSTLRSHLGQKELIPVSCDCGNACQ